MLKIQLLLYFYTQKPKMLKNPVFLHNCVLSAGHPIDSLEFLEIHSFLPGMALLQNAKGVITRLPQNLHGTHKVIEKLTILNILCKLLHF